MKKKISLVLMGLMAIMLVGCSDNPTDVNDKKESGQTNNIQKEEDDQKEDDQNSQNNDEEDWYGGGDLDDRVDDSDLSKEEQALNRELGKLDDGRYEIEVVYPYEDRVRFNVLYRFGDKDKQVIDDVGQVSEAGKMPENDDDAITLKLDDKLQGKNITHRHGLYFIEVTDGVIVSVSN